MPSEERRPDRPVPPWLGSVAVIGALVGGGIGAVAITGWLVDAPLLFRLADDLPTMKVQTASAVVALAVALGCAWAGWAVAAQAGATLPLGLAFATLVERIAGVDLGIDHLWVVDRYSPAGQPPGRMASATAVSLVLLGLAVLSHRAPRASQGFAAGGFAIGYAGLLVYAYDPGAIGSAALFDTLSLPTAVAITALATGCLVLRPLDGPMAAFTGADLGGHMLRRLVPPVLLVPAATGFLASRSGQPAGFAFTIGAALDALVFAIVLVATASALRQAEANQARAERDSRAREQHLATTLDSIGDGVIATDAAGRITRMNPVAARLTGWSPREAVGRHLAEVYVAQPEGLDVSEDPVEHVLREGTARSMHRAVLTDRERTTRPIADSGAPIRTPTGEIEGVVLVFRDLTSERAQETRIRQMQKMEAVGRLAGGIAHDFNNMLAVMVSYVSFARENATMPQVREDLDEVLRAADMATALTKQLLSFSRRTRGAQRPVDVRAMAFGAQRMLERTLGDRVRVRFHVDDAPMWVTADLEQLTQVLVNLGINARDAMPDGGDLTVTVSPRPPAADQPSDRNGTIEIVVSDTGHGIPPEIKDRLFEPFLTTKGRGKGTGLGLATSFGIVTQAGGTIEATSEVGAGATFRITLPAIPENLAPPAVMPTTIAPSRGETVLVAEDHASVLRSMARSLQGAGYRVILATGVAEATARAASHDGPIHLLLTDGVMADGLGPELGDALRAVRPELRVLVVTGHDDHAIGGRVDESRAVHALIKPFRPDDLLRRVREVLDLQATPTT